MILTFGESASLFSFISEDAKEAENDEDTLGLRHEATKLEQVTLEAQCVCSLRADAGHDSAGSHVQEFGQANPSPVYGVFRDCFFVPES